MKLRSEALAHYFDDIKSIRVEPTKGGVNNICDYVTNTETGDRYVLRIYNNGCDSVRVHFEHEVLEALLNSSHLLSFRLPTAVGCKNEGRKHIVLTNGAEATLFEFIPGELPKTTRAREIGRASGELVTALGQLNIEMTSPNPRFCELYKAHHATTREIFFDEVKKSCFDSTPNSRKFINLLCDEILEIEIKIERMLTLDLPFQLIHADLHYDNVLCDGDMVSGLLDFEFSVHDWRGELHLSFLVSIAYLIIKLFSLLKYLFVLDTLPLYFLIE